MGIATVIRKVIFWVNCWKCFQNLFSKYSFNCGKVYTMKFIILTIISVHVCGTKYIYIAVQPLYHYHDPSPELFHFPQMELCPHETLTPPFSWLRVGKFCLSSKGTSSLFHWSFLLFLVSRHLFPSWSLWFPSSY